MLQYGNTLQICTFHKYSNYVKKYLPKLKDGTRVTNLKDYCEKILENFINYFGYNPDVVPNTKTLAGGHEGIGTISNIFGKVHAQYKNVSADYDECRYLDLIKNKIIQDLSGIPWPDLKMNWGDPDKERGEIEEIPMDMRVMMKNKIRNVQDVKKQDKIERSKLDKYKDYVESHEKKEKTKTSTKKKTKT